MNQVYYSPEFFASILDPSKQLTQSGKGGVNFYQSQLRQRGFGFASLLRSIGNFLIPIAKSTLLPAVRPALRNLASGVLTDLTGGENFRRSVKSRAKQALKETGNTLLGRQSGSGARKRKTKKKKSTGRRGSVKSDSRCKKEPLITRRYRRNVLFSR